MAPICWSGSAWLFSVYGYLITIETSYENPSAMLPYPREESRWKDVLTRRSVYYSYTGHSVELEDNFLLKSARSIADPIFEPWHVWHVNVSCQHPFILWKKTPARVLAVKKYIRSRIDTAWDLFAFPHPHSILAGKSKTPPSSIICRHFSCQTIRMIGLKLQELKKPRPYSST